MAERNRYADGEPCWADVACPDPDAAQRFYAAVFGWTFVDAGADLATYRTCYSHGRSVAGITGPPPGNPTPPMWSLYLASSDVNVTANRAEELGAKIMVGPLEIPDNGHMLYGFDPTGAAFGVWQPGKHTGAQLYGEPGALSWAELMTRDPQAADSFYGGLFDYAQQQIGDGTTLDYSVWSIDDRDVAGRMRMPSDTAAEIPPHWLVCFGVDDVDAAIQRITGAGGQLQHGPVDSPYGRYAVVADLYGAQFSIVDESRKVG